MLASGSEGSWNSTLRWRRSAEKIDMMRSSVRLSEFDARSQITAFQRTEKRMAESGYIARTSPFSRIDQLPSLSD